MEVKEFTLDQKINFLEKYLKGQKKVNYIEPGVPPFQSYLCNYLEEHLELNNLVSYDNKEKTFKLYFPELANLIIKQTLKNRPFPKNKPFENVAWNHHDDRINDIENLLKTLKKNV